MGKRLVILLTVTWMVALMTSSLYNPQFLPTDTLSNNTLGIPRLDSLQISGRAHLPHTPIVINGNREFTPANGVTGGTGTLGDPYMIEGWEINATDPTNQIWFYHGILVENTNVYFTIRNVLIHGESTPPDCGRGGSCIRAMRLDNVTHGHVIDSALSGFFWAGITAGGLDTLISNNDFTNASADIAVGSGSTVSGNFASSKYGSGIEAGGPNTTIRDNTGFDVGVGADTSGVTVTHNIFYSHQGLEISSSTNVTVSKNTFSSVGVRIQGFDYSGSIPFAPFAVGGSVNMFNSHTITKDNTINGKPIYYFKNCDNASINNVPVGELIVANCSNFKAYNIKVQNDLVGITLAYVKDAIISDSKILNNTMGMDVRYSDKITLSNNDFVSNGGWDTVWSTHLTNSYVVDNWFSNNHGRALSLSYSNNTIISGNDMVEDKEPFESNIALVNATYTQVYHNNFIMPANYTGYGSEDYQTGILGYQPGSHNSWDNGYPSGGNYWSSYKTLDNCSGASQNVCPDPDGISDKPLTVITQYGTILCAYLVDHYPLMKPLSHIAGNTPVTSDFTITAIPTSVTGQTGTTVTVTVTFTPQNGFAGIVKLTSMVLPSTGLTATLSKSSISGPGSVTLTLHLVKPGSYTVEVRGSTNYLSHGVPVIVTATESQTSDPTGNQQPNTVTSTTSKSVTPSQPNTATTDKKTMFGFVPMVFYSLIGGLVVLVAGTAVLVKRRVLYLKSHVIFAQERRGNLFL